MTLLSLLNRARPIHIIVSGIFLIAINLLVNLFSAESESLRIFNAAFGLIMSVPVCFAILLIYRISKKNSFVFSRTLLWLGFTMLLWSLGDALYIFLICIDVDPFISPADFFYIAATLLMIVSVMTIPASLPPSSRRNMVFIEISILVLSAAVIFIILLLLRGNPDLNFDILTFLMVFIYPVLDTILIWVIMILFFTYPVKSSQRVLGILFSGSMCIFFSDLFYLVNSVYAPFGRDYLVDSGYYAFYILILIAGLTGFKQIRERTSDIEKNTTAFNSGNWIIFVPGAFLIIVIGLLVGFVLNQSIVLSQVIIILIAFIIILFIIHQYLVIADNIRLAREMRQINAQLESKVELRTAELSKANIELQDEMKERERAEEHLARSNQDLALLNRDKDKLFSILAHDLRSPLGSMMNLSELLVENIKDFDENEIMDIISTLSKSATHTFQLFNDLLAWSAVQMGRGEREKELFGLSEVVSENIAVLTLDAERKQIVIQSDIDPSLVAYADKFAIQTVVRNLISNAVKFTRHQGAINVNSEQLNDLIKISVTDNGVGMSKEKQKKIFRVDAVSSSAGTDGEKGTGFGLLLCKDLVERNGGKIWLESEKGKGSTFSFTLPIHNEKDELILIQVEKPFTRIEYHLDDTRKLGFTTLFGNFNSAVLKLELTRLWSSSQFNPNYSVLIDIRKAAFTVNSNVLSEFLNIFMAMPNNRTNRKFAVLTETPIQVAYSTIFGQFIKSKFPLVVEVFSTYEGAMTWLGGETDLTE